MKTLQTLILGFLLSIGALVVPAVAQVSVAAACSVQTLPVGYANGTLIQLQNGDLCIVGGGGGGATLQPFAPDVGGNTTMAPTTSTSRIALPVTNGTTVVLENTGQVNLRIDYGDSSITASPTSFLLLPGQLFNTSPGLNTYIAAVSDSNTGSLYIARGFGTATSGIAQNLAAAAPVVGSVAAGSTVADAPVMAGCRASTALPTAATDGKVVNLRCSKYGNAIASLWAPAELWGDQNTTLTATTTATDCLTAGGSGNTTNIMAITLNNSSAMDTVVQIFDTDGTTLRWTGTAKANDQRGIVLPGPLKGAATNVSWKCKTVTSVSSVVFTLNYFVN